MKKLFGCIFDNKMKTNLTISLISITFFVALINLPVVLTSLQWLVGVLSPILVAMLLAYILNPIVIYFHNVVFKRFKNTKFKYGIAITATYIATLLLVILLFFSIIPQLISSIGILVDNFSLYIAQLEVTLGHFNSLEILKSIDLNEIIGSWGELIKNISAWIGGNLSDIVGASIGIGSSIFNFILSLALSVYMLIEKERVKQTMAKLFLGSIGKEKYTRVKTIASRTNELFKNFLSGNLLDAFIIGILNFIFMLIFGMEYAVLISFIAGVTNFIPTFGPFIGAVPNVFILLLVNPAHAIWFVIWTIVLQTLDGYVIKPILFGDATGLSPMWVFIAIVIGGNLLGIVGMIIGIPIVALLSSLINEKLESRLKNSTINLEEEFDELKSGSALDLKESSN